MWYVEKPLALVALAVVLRDLGYLNLLSQFPELPIQEGQIHHRVNHQIDFHVLLSHALMYCHLHHSARQLACSLNRHCPGPFIAQ